MRVFSIERKSGFTIVEILVSLAVIAILTTVVYGALGAMRAKARDTERISELEQIRVALRLYKDQTGDYPTGHNSGTVIGEGGSLDATMDSFLANTVSDPLGSASDTTYEYVYDTQFSCSSVNRIVLYAKSMELPGNSNWSTVCGTAVSGGTNTYGVVLE